MEKIEKVVVNKFVANTIELVRDKHIIKDNPFLVMKYLMKKLDGSVLQFASDNGITLVELARAIEDGYDLEEDFEFSVGDIVSNKGVMLSIIEVDVKNKTVTTSGNEYVHRTRFVNPKEDLIMVAKNKSRLD